MAEKKDKLPLPPAKKYQAIYQIISQAEASNDNDLVKKWKLVLAALMKRDRTK